MCVFELVKHYILFWERFILPEHNIQTLRCTALSERACHPSSLSLQVFMKELR